MNSDLEKAKVAGLRPATSELTNDVWSSVSFNPHATTVSQICQTNDDTLTLTDAEAIEYSEWDVSAWVETRVMGGYMTPSTARDLYGWCPDWLRDFAVERYSMAAAGY